MRAVDVSLRISLDVEWKFERKYLEERQEQGLVLA